METSSLFKKHNQGKNFLFKIKCKNRRRENGKKKYLLQNERAELSLELALWISLLIFILLGFITIAEVFNDEHRVTTTKFSQEW